MSDNFDLKKYLIENKATANSKMLNEYFEKESDSLEQAFEKAGIDMSKPITAVKISGHAYSPGYETDDSMQVDPKSFLKKLEVEKAELEEEEGEAVIYDYDAADSYPAEDMNLPSTMVPKLSVMFSDSYEYVIYQEEGMLKEGSPMNDPRTKQVIQMLKDMDVDGETMEYILRQVGMDDQMASQLVGNKMSETKKKHSKMMKENTGNFFIDFKSEFANYIQDYEEGGLDEEVNVVDTNMGIDEWYQYPKTSVLVNHAVKSLQAAGVDSIEKLYAKNNLKYTGESLDEFFQNLEVNETYRGVDFTLIPGVDFSFTEEV